MDRSQFLRKLPSVPGRVASDDSEMDVRRTMSHPDRLNQTAPELRSQAQPTSPRSLTSASDLRRTNVQLRKDLEQERLYSKRLRREKVMEVRQAREDEQRKFSSLQTELKSRLHREKVNEITALKEQMLKEREKEILQIVKQKDEMIKSAQLNWAKEKEEICNRVKVEVFNEAREEAKKNLEGERVRLEQEIIDLSRRNKELEESYKNIQEQDKRKAEDIRRMFREHENELEKMKRNSWQESRRQMSEIRQLLNIIEQLEKKLGIESGHSVKLRMQKENLSEELKKLQSSDYLGLGLDNSPESKQSSGQDRILHRRNVELSSLVKKLDEKNQQLITRNTELLSELEKLEWDARSKNRKGDKKVVDLTQTVKKLELRNKTLLDEVNNLKRKAKSRIPGSSDARTGKERHAQLRSVPTQQEKDEVGRLKAQLRDQSKTILELKQSLMEKERRIDLLKQRRKNTRRKQLSLESLSVPDDDAVSILSDVSDMSEIQAGDNDTDSRRVRKLAKELLALERAYALLQATAGSAVDAEREETEKQQLQSDLIDSQSTIHKLERMLEQNIQGSGDIASLQEDNKALYQKLVAAEKERDTVKYQLEKNKEDVRDLQDQRELLEFELEEMSQLSAMGSDDENPFSPRQNVLLERRRSEDDIPQQLSAEEIKACLEKLENEKNNLLTAKEQSTLKQARTLIDSNAKEIEFLQSSESSLKEKINDLKEKHLKEMEILSSRNMATQGSMTDLVWTELVELENQYRGYLENMRGMGEIVSRKVETKEIDCMTDVTSVDVDELELFHKQNVENQEVNEFGEIHLVNQDDNVGMEERECMTDVTSVDIEELELFHKQNLVNHEDSFFGSVPTREQGSLTELTLPDIEYFEELEVLQEENTVDGVKPLVSKLGNQQEDKGVVTDFTLADIEYLEEMELEHQDCPTNKDMGSGIGNGNNFGFGFTEHEDKASMTDFSVSDLQYLEEVEETHQNCVMEKDTYNTKTNYGWKEQEEKGCGTDLTIPDLEYLEEFENVHQDCTELRTFQEKDITSMNTNRNEQECMTDLTLTDLQYLEEVDFVHQDCGVEKDQRTGQSESTTDQKENCTMTDLTIPEVDYLEQLEAVHREIIEDYKSLKSSAGDAEGRENKEVETEMTFEHLELLEDLEIFHKENEEAIENVLGEKLGRLKKTEGASKWYGFGRKRTFSSKREGTTTKCSIEVMTDLTNDGVKYLEEFVRKNRDVKAEKEYIDNATFVPSMQSVSRTQSIRKADSGVGTDLTIPDLEHLEETETLYRELSEKSVLERADANTRDDKNSETVLTLMGLQQLENLAKSVVGEDAMKKELNRKPGVASETSALYVNTMKLEYEEPGFDSIQVVLKPSHKQEVIADSLSRSEEEYSPEDRPPLTRRSSSTVSVSSVHSWGRSFTVTSGARENEVVFADDLGMPWELGRERKTSETNKEGGTPSLKYIRKITEEEEISPEVCDIEESLPNQWCLAGEDLNTTERKGEIPQGLPGVFDVTGDDQQVFYTKPPTNQMNTAAGDSDARRGSAVEQFDQFLKERKQSELSTMLSLRQSTDEEPHQEEASLTVLEELQKENVALNIRIRELENAQQDVEELVSENELLKSKVKQLQEYHDKTEEVTKDLEKTNPSLRDKSFEKEDEEERLKSENTALTERVRELERTVGADELVKENTDLRGQIRELSIKETQLLRDQIEELKDYKSKSVEIIEDLLKENAEKTQEAEIAEHLETENDELKTRIRQLEKTLAATSEELTMENGALKKQIAEFENGKRTAAKVSEELKEEKELLKGQMEQLRNRNEEISKSSEALEKENELLREQIAELVETHNRPDEVSEELERENKLLRDHVEHLEDGKDRFIETCEALRKENELLRDQIQELENEKEKYIQELQDLQRENRESKQQSADDVDGRLKLPEDLTQELEVLKNKVQELEEQRDKCIEAIDDYEKEVKLLRDQSTEFDESRGVFAETIDDLRSKNQQLTKQIGKLENSRVNHAETVGELENENEALKKKVQELEQQRDKCAEAIEEYEKEVKLLRDQSGELDESRGVFTETIEELRTENDQLRNQIQELEDNRDKYAEITDDLENENASLRDKVMQLEKSNQATENLGLENSLLRDKIEELENAKKGDLTDDELELLYQKIEQLKEAEQKIGMLNETNTILRQRIDQIQYEATDGKSEASTRDGWSETDEIQKGRLLLVHDLGLTQSEIESLLTPVEGFTRTNTGMSDSSRKTPTAAYDQADQSVQASVVVQSTNREIQTAGDLMKLVELSYDGSIPDHIAKELEKLKKENKELFEELMELRRKSQEAATEPASDNRRNLTEKGKRKDKFTPDEAAVRTPQSAHLISEPRVMSERAAEDSMLSTDDLHERIDELSKLDMDLEDVSFSGSPEETQDLDLEDGGPPPPPPDMSPPPIPTGPPPDFIDETVLALDPDTEDLLGHSPPRIAANLRPASRQRPCDEEPLLQEQCETQAKTEPDLLGASTEDAEGSSFWRPPPLSPASSSTKPRMRPILSEKSPKISSPSLYKQGGHLNREQTSQESSKKAPPPTLPKPKRSGSREWPPKQHSLPVVPASASRFAPAVAVPSESVLARQDRGYMDPDEMGLPPRGSVLARASSINQGQLDALNEKIVFLEKQLKNKESVIRTMRVEATELETQAMLERRDKEVKILEDEIAFLKQENQKKERDLLAKIGEVNRKGYEVEQWKAEANSSERQRKRMESAYLNLQNQLRTLQAADSKLAQLEAKHTGMEKHNWELSEKVKKLEKTEKEFKELEYNIQVLQNQLQDMESVEKDRDELLQKLKIVEQQRDELLRKGRMVESERNDFLRNNKMMEMQRDDMEGRYEMMNKTNASLKTKLAELEQDFKESQNRSHDVQHERNFVQSQCNKLQAERDELQKRLADVTQERNRLENLVAELQDFNRDHLKLEEGFHTLRLKVAELTRQKDDAEMQVPTLKAKTALLRQACKEKDGLIDKLNSEIQELRHSIATSTLDDLSKIRSYGYSSPENYVKFSRRSEFERALKPRSSEDLIQSKLNEKVGSSPREQKRKKKGSSRGSHAHKPYVALFDYDPYKSNTSGHPELELTLRKGDHVTIFGEMDLNGYFEAELNGVRGLVPSLFVEEADENIARLNNERNKSNALRDSPTAPYREPYRPFNDVSPQGYKPDNTSSGHSTMSAGTSYAGSEPQRQCFVALYDYSPYQSCTTGRPELELAFKKGDILTVIGDMDPSGYYKAEMNGRTGLVPSNFVEEVASSTYLQSSSTKAPEQILGVLDNIQVPGRRTGREIVPAPVIPNALHSGYPNNDVIYRTQYPQASPVQYGTVTVNVKPVSSVTSLPRAQPIVAITTAQEPSSMTSYPAPLVATSVSRPRQIRPVTTAGSVSSPGSLHVLRPVNQDAMLLGWTLPDMDEFGQSNGTPLRGYRIYANGDLKMDVKSAYMAKALVEDLDLRHPIQFAIQSVGEDGSLSNKAVAKLTDTISETSISPRDNGEDCSSDDGEHFTTHVALYDYDPYKSSPNPNPAYELAFKEGDILRVTDTSRRDGFYHGELRGKKGLIPSNFVEEVAVAPSRRTGSRSTKRSRNRGPRQAVPQVRQSNDHVSPTSPIPAGKRKTMVALYDYSPEEQSPQDNPDSELPFKKGQMITVIGGMNAAGFYQAEHNGHYGLVPSSFLEEYIKCE